MARPTYTGATPALTVGPGGMFADLWNGAASGIVVDVVSIVPLPQYAVPAPPPDPDPVPEIMPWEDGYVDPGPAPPPGPGVELQIIRTTSIGTGGSAGSLVARSGVPLDANVSARLLPTGGAARGAVLCGMSPDNDRDDNAKSERGKRSNGESWTEGILVPPNSGIAIVRTSLPSQGALRFAFIFRANPL